MRTSWSTSRTRVLVACGTIVFSGPAAAGAPRGLLSASKKAEAFSLVSASSSSGSESYRSVAPARTCAVPRLTRIVRSVSPVFSVPSKRIMPTAPPYQHRGVFSFCSTKRIAQVFGAPVTVTAHVCARNASIASSPSRR